MDASIILGGQPLDLIGAMDRGRAAAENKINLDRQNALNALIRDQGAAIMAGDQNALNALAGYDPQAALGIKSTVQSNAWAEEDRAAAKAEGKRMAEEAMKANADKLTAEQMAAERDAIARGLSGAAFFYQKGDKAGYEQFLGQAGLNPAEFPFESFPAHAAMFEGALEAMDAFAPPKPVNPTDGAPSGYMFTDPNNPAAGVAKLPGYEAKPGVVVNTGENGGAFTKKIEEKAAERFDGYIQQGVDAQRMVGDIKALADLAVNIGTGKGAEITATLGPYAEMLGVSIDGLSESQAFQSIVDRMAPAMRTPGAGATSDFDAKQFLSSLPQLGRTPEGNAIIMETLAAIQQHKVKAAEIAQRATLPPGDPNALTWQEADQAIAAIGNPYDAFNSYRKQKGIGQKDKVVIGDYIVEAIE